MYISKVPSLKGQMEERLQYKQVLYIYHMVIKRKQEHTKQPNYLFSI